MFVHIILIFFENLASQAHHTDSLYKPRMSAAACALHTCTLKLSTRFPEDMQPSTICNDMFHWTWMAILRSSPIELHRQIWLGRKSCLQLCLQFSKLGSPSGCFGLVNWILSNSAHGLWTATSALGTGTEPSSFLQGFLGWSLERSGRWPTSWAVLKVTPWGFSVVCQVHAATGWAWMRQIRSSADMWHAPTLFNLGMSHDLTLLPSWVGSAPVSGLPPRH